MELADAIEQWGLGHRTQLDDADIRLLREVWSTVRRSPLGEIEIDELSAADSKRVMALFGRERRRAVAEVLNVITAWAQTDGDTPVRRRPRPKPSAARPAPAVEAEPEAARPERSRRGRRGKAADKAESGRADERGHPETRTSRRPREFAAAGEDPERAPDAGPDELTDEASDTPAAQRSDEELPGAVDAPDGELAEDDDAAAEPSAEDAAVDEIEAEVATEPDDEGDASPGDNGDDPSDEDAADEDPSDRAADDASVDLGDEDSAEGAEDDIADSTEDDSAEDDASAEDAAGDSGEDPSDDAESDDAESDEGEASESTDEGFDVDDWERELTAAAEADAEPDSTEIDSNEIDSTEIDLGAAEAGPSKTAAALDEPLPPVELGTGTVDEPSTLIDHIDQVGVSEDTPVLNRGWTVVFSIVGLLTVIALFVLVYFLFLT